MKNPEFVLNQQAEWTVEQARQLYKIPGWSEGYFDINDAGHVVACPYRDSRQIDLYQLTASLRDAGYVTPVLLRFTEILQHRVDALCEAFDQARQQHDYNAPFTAVYPIKVNQQRKVVEDIIGHGGNRIGLEAGSKPELLTILALSQAGNTVVCNGYKDREYIRIALIGQQLGLRVYIVVEKFSELKSILQLSREMQIRPRIGVRVRLASIAEGNWQNTGGEKSKFGLHSGQVLQLVQELEHAGMLDCLELLHFHVGSQVSNIQHFQRALHEGARFYSELHAMGAPVNCVDVGGGLGVDYEGTKSRNFCSVNYTLQSYADTVVHALAGICRELALPQPAIITESGRAMTAHHALLVTNVIGVEHVPGANKPHAAGRNEPDVVRNLWKLLQGINRKCALENYNDALFQFNDAQEQFVHGLLDLQHRARVEEIFYAICRRAQALLKKDQQELLDELNEKLADKYFCNFSLFQSLPDSWAIDQIFPIVPLHRLHERPTQRAMIEDLTCDSDGMVRQYVEGDGITTSLPVHGINENDIYLIGIFMLGAYQEILGDMHNLFGDTTSVNIEMDADGEFRLTEIHQGESVIDLLDYVHINGKTLEKCFHEKIRAAQLDDTNREYYLDQLVQGLDGYTYHED